MTESMFPWYPSIIKETGLAAKSTRAQVGILGIRRWSQTIAKTVPR
jgi:hypothetical protein